MGHQLSYTFYRHFIQPSVSQIKGQSDIISRAWDPEPGACLVPLIALLHPGDLIYMHIDSAKHIDLLLIAIKAFIT